MTRAPSVWDIMGISPARLGFDPEALLELARTFALAQRFLTANLAPVGIPPPQFGVLVMLAQTPEGIPQDNVRKRLLCSRPNLTGLIDRLVRVGAVARDRDAKDGRKRILRITEKGRGLLGRAWTVHRPSVERFLAPLPRSDRKHLAGLLSRLRAPLEADA